MIFFFRKKENRFHVAVRLFSCKSQKTSIKLTLRRRFRLTQHLLNYKKGQHVLFAQLFFTPSPVGPFSHMGDSMYSRDNTKMW